MKLTKEEIQSIATLARLELSEQEKEMYADQLSAVLEYIGMLNDVDTSNVVETCQVTGLEDVFREDIVVESDPELKQKLIESFPEHSGALLKVRAVFDTNQE